MDTSICWSCKLSQAAGYVRASWAIVPGRLLGSGKSRYSSINAPAGSQGTRPPNSRPKGGQELVQGQRPMFPEPTSKSPVVIISYPKITAGPSLVKRKLGSNHWDEVHERIQGQKRDAAQCGASYQSCPASLNGGCCPTDRICGSSSCLPNTSTTVTSACGKANYIACGIPEGGGCCPSDYICATDGCTPSPGVSVTSTCSAGYFLCPAAFNYGCCKNGLGCAVNSCYSTDPVTFTITETTTSTDSNSIVHTITTTITSETVVGAPTTTVLGGAVISKMSAVPVTDTPIPKTSPTATSAASGGLTTPELGGIIGGASFFLIVIIVAAFFILRRLNKAIKVTEAANSRATSSERRSRRSRQTPSMQQDIDAMSVDPLMMTPSEVSYSLRRSSQQSTLHTTTHELASPGSPPVFHHPFQTITPHGQYQQGYNPVASSESQYSGSSGGHNRHPSVELSPPLRHNPNAGYFDFPPQSNPRYSHVSSLPGRRPSQHGRNWSDASDLSAVSQSSDPAELDGDDRRSGILNKLRRSFSRRKSDPPVLSGGPARVDWKGTGNIGGGLGHIAEAGESRIAVDNSDGIRITNSELREISLLDQPVQYKKKDGNPEYDQKVIGRRVDLLGGERKVGSAS